MSSHLSTTEIEAAMAALGSSPTDNGTVEMIVTRAAEGERTVLEEAELDLTIGVVGDNWLTRGSRHTPDGSALPDAQIAIMNSRVIQAVAGTRERWQLAGDQLFLDLELSEENLPPGQRLAIGTAVIEITAKAHTGCDKFTARFGSDGIRYVNGKEGRAARRRGIYARVVQPGTIRTGDRVVKIEQPLANEPQAATTLVEGTI